MERQLPSIAMIGRIYAKDRLPIFQEAALRVNHQQGEGYIAISENSEGTHPDAALLTERETVIVVGGRWAQEGKTINEFWDTVSMLLVQRYLKGEI